MCLRIKACDVWCLEPFKFMSVKKKFTSKDKHCQCNEHEKRGGLTKEKHHCKNSPTSTSQAASIMRVTLKLCRIISQISRSKRRQSFDFTSAHQISRHRSRIVNHYSRATCVTIVFINVMYSFQHVQPPQSVPLILYQTAT